MLSGAIQSLLGRSTLSTPRPVGLASLPLNSPAESLSQIQHLVSLNDKLEKPFSQILAKKLVDTLPLEQVVLFTAHLLEERFKSKVGRNIAMVFRNSEMFAFQMAYAVLRKMGYPLNPDNPSFATIESVLGVPLTPRSRNRSDSESSAASVKSVSSNESIGRVESSESLSVDELAVQFEAPASVVTLLLPLYKSYVGSMNEEDKVGAKENFAGQFLFSFFTTPLQAYLEEDKNEAANAAQWQRFKDGLKAVNSNKVTLLRDLLQKLDDAMANHTAQEISLETLYSFQKSYQSARREFENIVLPLKQIKQLNELYRDLAESAEHDDLRKIFKKHEKTLETAKETFLNNVSKETGKAGSLDIAKIHTAANALKVALDEFSLVYNNTHFGGMTPLHRLCTQKPNSERERKAQLERIRLLLSLGADFKATTQVYSENVVRNALVNLASGKLSTAPKPITARELAEKEGLSEVAALLKEAESGKDFREYPKAIVEISPLLTEPPRPPSILAKQSSSWLSAQPTQAKRMNFEEEAGLAEIAQNKAEEESASPCTAPDRTEEESDVSCEDAASDNEEVIDIDEVLAKNPLPIRHLSDQKPFNLQKSVPENPSVRAVLREKGKRRR